MSGQERESAGRPGPRYRELAELVSQRRVTKYPTPADFTADLKLHGCNYSEDMVKKIERGERPIAPDHLHVYSQLLFGKPAGPGLQQLQDACEVGRRRDSKPALFKATTLAHENAVRAKKIDEDNGTLTALLRAAAEKLEDSAKRGQALLVTITESIRDSEEGQKSAIDALNKIAEPPPQQHEGSTTSPEEALRGHRSRLAGDLAGLLGRAGAAGAGGAAAGAGAAAVTFATVSALATASTGTAISVLSGAAASSATLAWLGGGALAAGGAGVAGGVAVLTSIVGVFAAAAAGAALIGAGPRMLEKQNKVSVELVRREEDQRFNTEVISRFVSRAAIIDSIVTVGEVRVAALRGESGVGISERLAKILVNLATVMALPLAPVKDPDADGRLFDGTADNIVFVDLALNQAQRGISLA